MTYQNGREVKVGDTLTGYALTGEAPRAPVTGVVVEIRPGLRHFNAQVRIPSGGLISVTAGECLHTEDAPRNAPEPAPNVTGSAPAPQPSAA